MSSSFRRKLPTTPSTTSTPAAALRGTKPFLHGQTLASTGLAELDALLGGGLLLGTITWLDAPRDDHGGASAGLIQDLERYFVAEAVAAGQRAVVVSDDARGFVREQLPLELSLAQKIVKQQFAALELGKTVPQIPTEGGGNDDGKRDDPAGALTIAWQYEKYLAPTGSSNRACTTAAANNSRFCHSYDLSRPMHADLLAANPPVALDVDAAGPEPATQHYARLLAELQVQVNAATTEPRVIRLCLRELGSASVGPPTPEHMAAIVRFLRQLRAVVALGPVLCLISGIHLHAFPIPFSNDCRHLADYVMELRSFAGESDLLPGELVEFDGLLDLRRLARVHSLACHAVDAVKFGIKRERRKVKIEKFHLPPEGSRSMGDKSKPKGGGSSLVSSSVRATKSSHAGCSSSSAGTPTGFNPLAF